MHIPNDSVKVSARECWCKEGDLPPVEVQVPVDDVPPQEEGEGDQTEEDRDQNHFVLNLFVTMDAHFVWNSSTDTGGVFTLGSY